MLAALMQPYVDRHELAGAVLLVADIDTVLDLEVVGYADVKAQAPMQSDSLFWIASQSKPIAATALMMLVDEGKVDVEAPVAEYLPEYNDAWQVAEQDNKHQLLVRPSPAIAVHHLLAHTSGLPFSTSIEGPTRDMLPLHVTVRSYAATPLQSAPGSKYQYSNAGINTAARIVEVVCGIPYETFLDERIFHPLGMKDTTFWPSDEQIGRLAKCYRPTTDGKGIEEHLLVQLRYPFNDRSRFAMPGGGLFSTASDCAVFCQMILNGGIYAGNRYLSEAAVTKMTTRHTDPTWQESYGYGWDIGENTFGHSGAVSTNMEVNKKLGLITIFLVQHAGFPGDGGNCYQEFKQRAVDIYG